MSVGAVGRSLIRVVKSEPPVVESFDLNGAVRDMLPVLSAVAGRGVEVRLTPSSGAAPIEGDRDHLMQILLNLVVNARRAMKDRGHVTIMITPKEDWIELRVDDTGPGVPAALRRVVFEPYFTTRADGEGDGLGLASVRDMVDAMHGDISIREHEAGASFVIRFLRVDALVG